jgi:hypothetical protein
MRVAPALEFSRIDGKRSVARRNCARAAAVLLLAGAIAGCSSGKGVYDAANQLPFGSVDVPANGAEVNMLAGISGWALDDRGIREIRVYLDGRLATRAVPTAVRPDVNRTFPRMARPGVPSGWAMLMGYDSPGQHTVVVQAVDSDGATRDIGVVTVTAVDR